MALPASGVIRFSDIRTELGVPNQSPFKLGEAERGTYATINASSTVVASNPARISEWYNYAQVISPENTGTIYYTLK